ncbi:MAG: GIY-YIG nuclease family protein [Chlorobi bacterium]|nr:GIY-YIG nuclease family protein [Chlorobiota bacterium]MCI0715550.1 GIY-YIG nuclease family protein [Chlorobiota bacterium]
MPKKFIVYCLYSNSNKGLYIGHTDNLERRFSQHNSGKVLSTKAYKPYKLLHKEEFDTKQEAIVREKELKGSSGRRFLKKFKKISRRGGIG